MRIAKVKHRLYLGGACGSADALDQVLKRGITHILNLDDRCELNYQEHDDERPFTLMLCYIPDDGTPRPAWFWGATARFMLGALSADGTNLFIHCAAGRSRSVAACYLLLRLLGHRESEAHECLKAYDERLRMRDPDWKPFEITNGNVKNRYIPGAEIWLQHEGP